MERYMAETPGTLQGEGGKSEAGLLYGGKEALILEWVRPSTATDKHSGLQECHSLDIVTLALPDNTIELCTVLYWGDCSDGSTTHTTRAGYLVDVATETISSNAAWYAPYFAKDQGIGHLCSAPSSLKGKALEGHSLPGTL